MPGRAPVHDERRRPEQTALYRLLQQHAETLFACVQHATGAHLPQFVRDEFDAFLDCGVVAHGFLRLRCGDCSHDKLVAFSCKRRGFCASRGARRMAQSAARLVDCVIPHVPVRQWVLALPIPLRLLLASRPALLTPVLQVVHRVLTAFLLERCSLQPKQADSGAVTLIQRFDSAANLNIPLHCLVLDGVYQSDDAGPVFVEAPPPTDQEVQSALPHESGFDQTLCADMEASACTLRCSARLRSARGWSGCAAPSPARHWPMNACSSTPRDGSC